MFYQTIKTTSLIQYWVSCGVINKLMDFAASNYLLLDEVYFHSDFAFFG